ncbi:hypothetical protein J3E71DRAFT_395109 [Bipolaris maydis]|nr:hypothetical protein J3E71DRAFT_395109 [Bipolaris maydis]
MSSIEECGSLGVRENADPAQYRKCAEYTLGDKYRICSDTSFALTNESLVSRREVIRGVSDFFFSQGAGVTLRVCSRLHQELLLGTVAVLSSGALSTTIAVLMQGAVRASSRASCVAVDAKWQI